MSPRAALIWRSISMTLAGAVLAMGAPILGVVLGAVAVGVGVTLKRKGLLSWSIMPAASRNAGAATLVIAVAVTLVATAHDVSTISHASPIRYCHAGQVTC